MNRSICAIGRSTDATFVHFVTEAISRGESPLVIDLEDLLLHGEWCFAIGLETWGSLKTPGARVDIERIESVYTRPAPPPGMDRVTTSAWNGMMHGVRAWLSLTERLVINRPTAHQHNGSKQLHEAFLARCGLLVPPSVSSSDRDVLAAFTGAGPTIAKELSGLRAAVRLVHASDFVDTKQTALHHLQRQVVGTDIRAHVVDEDVIALSISSPLLDYRNDRTGRTFAPHRLPDELSDKLVDTTREMGLTFAGWDLKLDSDGIYWCLEANPMPGYQMYDRYCDGRITGALIHKLKHN